LAGVLATWLRADATEEAFWSVSDPGKDRKASAETSFTEDDLWRRHIPGPRSLLRLAANPFMLTMLYQVWVFEGDLPRNRGDLFDRFVDRLLSREGLLVQDRDRGAWQRTPAGVRLLAGLTGIAWIMQGERLSQGGGRDGDLGVLTLLPRAVALTELDSEARLKQAEDATLLEGQEEIRFRHQLLQEYFTARALQQRIAAEGLRAADLWPEGRWWARSGWEEAAVLLVGLHSETARRSSAGSGTPARGRRPVRPGE